MRKFILSVGFFAFLLAGCGGTSGGGGTTVTPTAATPAFTPAAGTFTAAQSVTLADATSGASIYYTTNGTTPTSASSLYSSSTPIAVGATTTINAIAIASGYLNSAVASATYTINLPAATPTFSPAPGTYTAAQSVTLADTTTGASIYYTTDNSTPTSGSTLFSPATPIAVNATTTIKAVAIASGFSTSAVASATYTINLPPAATPSFSPAPGSYPSAQSVSLLDATTGASIYYTTDGSTPTTSSTLFSATAPISISQTTTINAMAVATNYSPSAVASGTFTIAGSISPVSVVLTTNDQTKLMTAQPNVHFAASAADAGANTIVIDPTQQYQTIDGFGAAFTDSAAWLLMKVEPPANLPGTLSDLFTRTGNGIGLSFMRIPMGASDIALSVYSYDDQSAGTTDLPLTHFSIAHDQAYILPLITQALALNPQMKLMANPWSPPGWMKDPASMSPVSMLGGTLLLTPANETAFANYFVKFIQAYQAAGVPIDYISLQNEPLNITTAYPSMGMSDTVQLSLLQNDVLSALAANSLTTKVFVYDHNWDTPTYPQTALQGLTTQQLTQVAGTAWHGYGGVPGAQQLLQNQFPTLGNWETEHSGGTWISDQFTSDMLEITLVLRNSAKSYVKWSLALNENLGPDLTQNASLGGCNTCTPIVTVNSSTGAVTKDIEYYTLGHYSKYVLPGAVRIFSTNTPSVASVAFQNPDGSIALIAYNSSSASQTFQVQWGAMSFNYTLPATAAATFTWSGNQVGTTPPIAATSQIQGSSFYSEQSLQTEETADATGEYDLGYLTQGAYTVYKNVDFGTGAIQQVNVRTASGGNGGTATFYLDSMTSTPIATVTLPVTGGWQTWQTVKAAVTSVSGVHTLYVVFNGSTSSIANVNWFQFQ